jgi:hypothetical protein
MSAIPGMYVNGMIIPDVKPDWAEGARVSVELAEKLDVPDPEDESPEAIAKRIALMDRMEPPMSEQEALEWERHLKENREAQKGFLLKWAEEIRRTVP